MKKLDKLEYYQDANGEWRWRLTALNGKIRDSSSEGFNNFLDCEDNARKTGENLYFIFHPEERKE